MSQKKVVTLTEEDLEEIKKLLESGNLSPTKTKNAINKLNIALGAAKYCCDSPSDKKLK